MGSQFRNLDEASRIGVAIISKQQLVSSFWWLNFSSLPRARLGGGVQSFLILWFKVHLRHHTESESQESSTSPPRENLHPGPPRRSLRSGKAEALFNQ